MPLQTRLADLINVIGADIAQLREMNNVGYMYGAQLVNAWVNYGAGFDTAGYYYGHNRVYLKGLIKNGSLENSAFFLPLGYRPPQTEIFSVISANAIGRVDVQPNGNVVTRSPCNNIWVSLSGISFRVA
jgi:hypothetical protein